MVFLVLKKGVSKIQEVFHKGWYASGTRSYGKYLSRPGQSTWRMSLYGCLSIVFRLPWKTTTALVATSPFASTKISALVSGGYAGCNTKIMTEKRRWILSRWYQVN
jgi:hypothetical protein